ncbi:MAG TPA: hypothetical protein VF938_08260 [Candidatus Angelobacter sp.]
MNTFCKAVILAGLLGLSSGAYAFQAPQTAGGAGAPTGLENGSILYAELSKTVDAKKAKAGDPVSAVLIADVLSHGKIVARRDSKLAGHVTEAQPHSKDTPESRLGIVFDKVILKSGQEIPFVSVLMALSPAPRLQVESMSAPAPPGTTSPQPERHYPTPKGPSVPIPGSSKDPARKDMESITHGTSEDMSPSDIEGISLEKSADGSNRVAVSLRQTVKLESGVRLELRTGSAKP